MNQLYLADKEKNEHLKPNVIVYNSVLNACAFTNGDVRESSRAMEIAHKLLKEMELPNNPSPDQVTYGTFLKVCANQIPDCSTRQQIVEFLVQKCQRDGQVGNLVLKELKTVTDDYLFRKLIGRGIDEEIFMEELPQEWWCNVVEGKWRRRRNLS